MPFSLFPEPSPAPPDAHAEEDALIALTAAPGVGPTRLRALRALFGSAVEAQRASVQALAQVPGIGSKTARAIHAFVRKGEAAAVVAEQRERAERVGAEVVPGWDDRLPQQLSEIYDPPGLLWLRGTLVPEDACAVAIVGTRRATDYGKRVGHRLGRELAEAGVTVVSGLAYGIDAAAHRGALEGGGRTLAVLGSGVDRIYPARHTRLAEQIMEQGAVLSEEALGAEPDAPNFPRRNRIVSGLSLGVVVVEAHERGGALITARLALEQGREAFAVPGALDRPASIGTNRLIQRGHAKLVLSVEDILDELPVTVTPAEADAAAAPALDLPPLEQRLYDVLSDEPLHIDEVCTRADLDASSALVYLLNLEFKGAVRQLAGKQFYRV